MNTVAEVLALLRSAWEWTASTHPILVSLVLGGAMLWIIMRHD